MAEVAWGVPCALTCLQCLAGRAPAPHHLGKPQVSIKHALGHVDKPWGSPEPCWFPPCPGDSFLGWSHSPGIVPSLRGAKEKCGRCLQKQKFSLSCSRWDQRGTAAGTSTLSLVPASLARPLPRPKSAHGHTAEPDQHSLRSEQQQSKDGPSSLGRESWGRAGPAWTQEHIALGTALWRAGGIHGWRFPLLSSGNGNFPMMQLVPLLLILFPLPS